MARRSSLTQAFFKHLVYAPDGEIEGAILSQDESDVQWLLSHEDKLGARVVGALVEGSSVEAEVTLRQQSPKGASEHDVCLVGRIRSVDGAKPPRSQRSSPPPGYRGKVVRFNFARHGARNGVVLDSGDFIHTAPEAMSRLKVAVGDDLTADGDAWPLSTGTGWVVEATTVNGRKLNRR